MGKNLKKVLSVALSTALVMTSVVTGATDAAAAKTPKLAKNKVSVEVGATTKVKVKNVAKSAKVKVLKVKKKAVASVTAKKLNLNVTGKAEGKTNVIIKVTYKSGKKKVSKKLKLIVTVTPKSVTTAAPTAAPTTKSAATTAPPAAQTTAPVAPEETQTPVPEPTEAALIGVSTATYAEEIEVKDAPLPFRDYDSEEIIDAMGTGWNLGNTMDAVSNFFTNPISVSETAWQEIVTTKKLFKHVHDLGFSTIRIPVTWGLNLEGTINEARMSRVQELVDYALEEGMFVVLNVHHDGAPDNYKYQNLIRPATIEDADNLDDPVYVAYKKSWNTIANRFKNYDEHLIFESMNEVYTTREDGSGDGYDQNPENCKETIQKIMNMNQIFLDTVRNSGGNNAYRWVLVAPLNTRIDVVMNDEFGFKLPKDTLDSPRTMLSVHDYNSPPKTSGTDTSTLMGKYRRLREKYVDNGVPVIVGEYGSYNIISGKWSEAEDKRLQQPYQYEAFNYAAKKNRITICAWDTGNMIDRHAEGVTDWKKVIEAIFRGYYADEDGVGLDSRYGSTLKEVEAALDALVKAESIALDKDSLTLKVGDRESVAATLTPADNDDAAVWSSDDELVATVNMDGVIEAVSPGTTTITARSIYNDEVCAKLELTVEPVPVDTDFTVTDITTEHPQYRIAKNYPAFLNAKVVADKDISDSDEYDITYKSSDPELVYVDSVGRLLVVGDGDGEVTITMTAVGGFTKDILVDVVSKPGGIKDASKALNICLSMYYEDATEEKTATQMIDSDGVYTFTYDASNGKTKKTLEGVTAVYLQDPSQTEPVYKDAILKFKEIKVNDTVYTLRDDYTPVSPYKNNGNQFDTGNPLNGWANYNGKWDGSVVNEVSYDSSTHAIKYNLPNGEEAKTISVTFEITGIN